MQTKNTDKDQVKKKKKPDDNAGVYVSGHIKIYDPNTKEVFVSKREDG
jgi:hypothetical protein